MYTLRKGIGHCRSAMKLYVTGFTTPSKMAQKLKSKIKPNINETFMHCPEASTTWL